jgi:hypothetical protein
MKKTTCTAVRDGGCMVSELCHCFVGHRCFHRHSIFVHTLYDVGNRLLQNVRTLVPRYMISVDRRPNFAHTRTHTHIHTHARTHTSPHTPARTRAHARAHTHAHTRARTRMHIRTHIRAHTHTRTRTHTHRHTHAHARTHNLPTF